MVVWPVVFYGFILFYSSYIVLLASDIPLLTMANGHLWQGPNGQQHFMQDCELERSYFTSQFISPVEGNARSNARPIQSGSRPKPRPVFGVCSSVLFPCTLDISCPLRLHDNRADLKSLWPHFRSPKTPLPMTS